MDPLLWPHYSQDEIDAVVAVLKSGRTNQWGGQEVFAFEKAFADYLDCEQCVAVSNGSVALELAWAALDISLGDEIIVPARTFVASGSSVVVKGGIPVFADVDLETQNILPESIESLITDKTKAILCVHHAGCPCDMEQILGIAGKYRLRVVEDCAQATGTRYKGRKVGTFGDIGCFSFCQDKVMSTGGEGGMVSTSSEELWQKVWGLKDHGRNWGKMRKLKPRPSFPYFCDHIGGNYRMTEIQAAIGRKKLEKIDTWIRHRRNVAAMYDDCFSQYPFVRVPQYPDRYFHVFYEYYVFVVPERLPDKITSDNILTDLQKAGLPCNRGSCPEIYLEGAFEHCRYPDGSIRDLRPAKRLPNAKFLGENAIKMLVHPGYSKNDIEAYIKSITKVFDSYK